MTVGAGTIPGVSEPSGGSPAGDPQGVVERGYDKAALTHLEWLKGIEGDPRLDHVDTLLRLLPRRARILELGCGAGVPVTRRLAAEHEVTGVDVSRTQLDLARRLVPDGDFVQADMNRYDPGGKTFDAVVAVYSISHLPRSTHADLFARIASWLEPGGLFLASLGAQGCADTVEEWLGVPMFFSSFDADENRRLLRLAGFRTLVDEVVTMQEPEGPATFLWVLLRRGTP